MELPFSMNAVFIPQVKDIEGTPASFFSSFQIKDKTLIFKENVSLNKRVYEKERLACIQAGGKQSGQACCFKNYFK
jgi:hypothetical protein